MRRLRGAGAVRATAAPRCTCAAWSAQLQARGYDVERVALPVQVVSEGGDPRARGRLAPARSLRKQRPADRSRDRDEVPDLLRAASEQGRVADPSVPRGLRAVRHADTAISITPRATSASARPLIDLDTQMLGECRRIFANARNTAARLAKFNGLTAEPLYHPPHLADRLRPAPTATTCWRRPAGNRQAGAAGDRGDGAWSIGRSSCVLAGDGTQRANLEALAAALGVSDRVRFLGAISDDELLALYAGALAVVLCAVRRGLRLRDARSVPRAQARHHGDDSGGPLEFVVDGVNGAIVEPEAGGAGRGDQSRTRPIAPKAASHGDAGHARAADVTLGRRHREAGGRLVATLIIQIPCLNEAETLPATLRGPAAEPARHRPHRGPRHRRRVARRHRRRRAGSRRRSTSCACAAARAWLPRSWRASTRP